MQLIKKTIYLREEDLELWAACPNKSLLVHNALNDTTPRAVRVQDKLIVANGKDPLKYYDASTEKNYEPDVCTSHPNFRRNCGLIGCEYA